MVLPKSWRLERIVVIDRVLQPTMLASYLFILEPTADHRMNCFVLPVFQVRRHAEISPPTQPYVSATTEGLGEAGMLIPCTDPR